MVERCADCGFDLAAGEVEVIPTAHYMMGGVKFDGECRTAMPGLFAAGEDTGGVHGANRLGGNGVANSTVFGGLAGDSMAAQTNRSAALADPDGHALEAAVARAFAPLGRTRGDLEAIRRTLLDTMWNDVGIIRSTEGLTRGCATLDDLSRAVAECGVPDSDRRYNLTWMDRLNVENLIVVSRAIAAAAGQRSDSRGAHYRIETPHASALQRSVYTVVRMENGELETGTEQVMFSRVSPGETLIAAAG
jgi:fumarate reductase flavoprotein subunit